MGNDIKIIRIIFCCILAIIMLVILELFLHPLEYINWHPIKQITDRLNQSQEISPERLYINTWRKARLVYVDSSMNNQDWNRWKLKYKGQIKNIEDANIAINTMLLSLNDPYTKFLKADAFSKKMMVLDSKIMGIGLVLNKSDNGIVVNHIIENSPAQKANIIAGDTIVSIDGKSIDNNEFDNLIENIESGKTKKIEITIKRNNELVTQEILAGEIPINTMNYYITKDNIAIITLSNILGEKNNAINDFKKILIETNKTDAIIIDLRNNYGGRLVNAIEMINYMLDIDKIVSVESRINRKYQIYSANERIFLYKPIIILINKKTASAAEILAGSLKDNLNAILIGENSFGKNAIQQVIPMTNKTGLIITTDKYILPSGKDIHNIGLTPDIYITSKNYDNDEVIDEGLKIAAKLVKKRK